MHSRPARPGRRAPVGQAARPVPEQQASSSDATKQEENAPDDAIGGPSGAGEEAGAVSPHTPPSQATALPAGDIEPEEQRSKPQAGTKDLPTTEVDKDHAEKDAAGDANGQELSSSPRRQPDKEPSLPHTAPSDTQLVDNNEIPLQAVEDALRDLSRDDLVLALKNAKEQMDILDNRVEALTERNEALETTTSELSMQLSTVEGDRSGLEFALAHREERIDELMREQDRLEEDVYLRTEVNERLRKQLNELERARTDAERRYTEQTTSIDKERQFYLDQEKLLISQKSKSSAAYDRAHAAQQELIRENERLQVQISELRTSSPLRGKVGMLPSKSSQGSDLAAEATGKTSEANTTQSTNERLSVLEDQTPRSEARTLQDETESSNELDSLRAEHVALQTSHTSLTESMQQLQTELRDVRLSNADLRQQNQMFVDILQEKTINGDLVAGSAVLNRKYSDISTSDTSAETTESDDVPDSPSKGSNRNDKRKKRVSRLSTAEDEEPAGINLANELEDGQAQDMASGDEHKRHRHTRSAAASMDVAALQKDNQELRDANKALTLYVNKILDRIIAREGYENVLAVDSEQRRSLRAKASRMHLGNTRPTILPSSSPEKPSLTSRVGLGRGVPSTFEQDPQTPKTATSRDWRSYLPLVGSATTSQAAQSVQTSDASLIGSARRILSSEEVEDQRDQQERERIRQAMAKQGIELPEHQLKPQKRTSTSFGTFFSRVMGTPRRDDIMEEDAKPVTQPVHSPSLAVPHRPHEGSNNGQVVGATSDAESNPLSIRDMRQRALEADDTSSSNLTDVPERKERRLSRRVTSRSTSETSVKGTGLASPRQEKLGLTSDPMADVSRGPSEAGDESYGYVVAKTSGTATPTSGAVAPTDSSQETTWRKALKRVSMLYPAGSTVSSTGDATEQSPASVKSPTIPPPQ